MTEKAIKILVTGGAGFIGAHLVEALVANNFQVTVVDNLSSGKLSNLEKVLSRISFIEGDIREQKLLEEAARDCRFIFHLAAVVSVTKTVENPLGSSLVNELGTLGLLEAARYNKVHRVILSSSSAVYGDDPRIPKKESMPPCPKSPYAVQKLVNEHYAELYGELFGVETVCLRYFNVYGPRQDPSSPYSGVISIFMKQAALNQQPVIYGDGKQTRDFVYVEDVVRANMLAAQVPNAAGKVFNIGTGQMINISKLWNMVAKLAGTTAEPEYAPERSGDIRQSVADIEKSNRILGFRPRVELKTGLASTYQWYRERL